VESAAGRSQLRSGAVARGTMRTLAFLGRYLCTAAALVLGAAPVEAQAPCRAGTGRADITPRGPIWMAGYGSRNKPSEAVDAPLHARALALQSGEEPPLLLISAEIIGFRREVAEAIAGKLQGKFKLPRENILLVATHTHTGPVIGKNLKGMFDLKGKEADA